MKIMGIDPGETIGYSMFKKKHISCLEVDFTKNMPEYKNHKHYLIELNQLAVTNKVNTTGEKLIDFEKIDRFLKIIKELDPDVVAMENFRLYNSKARSKINSDFKTVQIIGIIKNYLHKNNIPYVLQMANKAKKFVSSKKLKQLGFYIKGFKHGRDSIRHVVYFIENRITMLEDGFELNKYTSDLNICNKINERGVEL